MKAVERLAIILMALWIVTLFSNPLVTYFIAEFYGPSQAAVVTKELALLSAVRNILALLVQIGIGVWLFIVARRERALPWIWLLFGFVFGISAAILFFVIRLYEETRQRAGAENS